MIDQQRITDASRALAFADDVRGAYSVLKEMEQKIQRYATGLATGSDAVFVQIVQAMVSPEDLARIGALQPAISALVTELETNYDDFLHPA